jgi:hypothetical protein
MSVRERRNFRAGDTISRGFTSRVPSNAYATMMYRSANFDEEVSGTHVAFDIR